MRQFTELDQDGFGKGFEIAKGAQGIPVGEAELAGFAFGTRLFKSISSDWEPGGHCDMTAVKRQLESVIRGELTLLPPPMDIQLQLDAAYQELIDGLPQEAVEEIEKSTREHRRLMQQKASTAAMDRREKDQFDREAAQMIVQTL